MPIFKKLSSVCGPKLLRDESRRPIDYTPLSIWCLYFTDSVIGEYVSNTNFYAQFTKYKKWTDVTIIEMKKFFAVLYLIGINGVTDMRDAWLHDMHSIPLLQKIMSLSIMANWHYLDTISLYLMALILFGLL